MRKVVTEEQLLADLQEDEEHIQAWIWTEEDGAYMLGPMRPGLGWVCEDNVVKGAELSPNRIYFLQWSTRVEN